MTEPVSRRNALGLFSTVGLGALLAACTGGDSSSSAPTRTTGTTVPTVEGGTATVSPRSRGTLTAASFAGASAFESASQGGPGGSGRTDEETYLRGAQVTNAEGIVEFTTIYPGSYRGRTVHIHCNVHLDRSELLTTQLGVRPTIVSGDVHVAALGVVETRRRMDGSEVVINQVVHPMWEEARS